MANFATWCNIFKPMARLPNVQKAYVDQDKLRDYCLNSEHPVGKHKAKGFYNKLGIGKEDSAFLAGQIYEAIQYAKALEQYEDQFGKRYAVDFPIKNGNLQATLRTAWIIKHHENFPGLLPRYIKKSAEIWPILKPPMSWRF